MVEKGRAKATSSLLGPVGGAAAATLGGDPDPEKSMSLEAGEQLGDPPGTPPRPSSAPSPISLECLSASYILSGQEPPTIF